MCGSENMCSKKLYTPAISIANLRYNFMNYKSNRKLIQIKYIKENY